MKQIELARQLGISKSYLSMILSKKRSVPKHLECKFCELCEQKQLQEVPSKQNVARSNRARDATLQS
jgi:transcriptional regulator with XRE-family HTH domain